ncbi:MAG: dephospho-CoA kinase, partial [Bacteroidota bacterium]
EPLPHPVKRPRPHILRVGVTGGIGSGKTLVCRELRRKGVPVLSADRIAKHLSTSDPVLNRRLRSLLGPRAFTSSGRLNRRTVARLLFSDPVLQKSMNRLIHPRVEKEIARRFGKLAEAGFLVGVVEAALIFEAGLHRRLDFVILVDATREKRIRRVVRRDGLRRSDVHRRMRAQWGSGRKRTLAHLILENNTTPASLRKKVRFLHSLLMMLARKEIP